MPNTLTKPKPRLRQVLNIMVVSAILGTTVAITLAMSYRLLMSRFNLLEQQALSHARLVALNSEYGIYTGNRSDLTRIATTLNDTAPWLELCFYDRISRLLCHHYDSPTATTPHRLDFPTELSQRLELVFLNWFAQPHLTIDLPVNGKGLFNDDLAAYTDPEIGSIRLTLDLTEIVGDLRRALLEAVLISLLITVLGIIITLRLSGRLVSPLSALSHAADTISLGHLDVQLPVHGTREVAHLICVFNRMTQQLADYREQDAKHRRELADKVTERTEQLKAALTRTEQLKTQAESASAAKSRFLATISHEIRTPLHAIIGFTELLMNLTLPARAQQHSQQILQAANALLEQINDILDFARMEAGYDNASEQTFALPELLDRVINLFAGQAQQKNLTLHQVSQGLPAHVRGYQRYLERILVNLLSNAVKFTPQGQVTLQVSVQDTTPDTVFLRFAVLDSGIGIAADQIERITHPFVQADDSAARQFAGSGLGLSLVSKALAAMHSELHIDSIPGEGSTFSFTVQLAVAPDAAHPALMPSPVRFAGGAKVLVVEDHPVNQCLIKEMLEHLGCRCDLADDGQQALSHVKRQAYQVILMDCQMPGLDGYQTARAIFDLKLQPAPVIIALTGDASEENRQRCQAAGMAGFLAKPCHLSVLHTELSHWLALAAAPEHNITVRHATSTTAAGLDEATLKQVRTLPNGAKVLEQVIELFLSRTPDQLEQLQQNVAERNCPATQALAHALKSASAQLGAKDLAQACWELEQYCRGGNTEQAGILLNNIVDTYQRASQALQSLYTDSRNQRPS
ncbi:MAG: response regulator [Methylococcales bacterium]|nr:response regulator [Methylococcales bacterium]